MKISELRKLIKEELDNLQAMARPAEGYKLTDGWEEILQGLIDNSEDKATQNKYTRYKEKLSTVKDDPYFKFPQLFTGGFTPIKNELIDLKVVEPAGVRMGKVGLYTPATKPTSTGVKGRPIEIDKDKKLQGLGLISKFSRGLTEYTPEEIELIKSLYNSIPKEGESSSEEK